MYTESENVYVTVLCTVKATDDVTYYDYVPNSACWMDDPCEEHVCVPE